MAGKLTRIHLHWTAGADGVNAEEKDHYHFIVGRDGGVTPRDPALDPVTVEVTVE